MTNEANQNTNQAEAGQPPSPDRQRTNQGAAQTVSPPYGMYVALAALVSISLVAFAAMLIFRDLFESATEVSTVLGSLFAVVGTVVGAYFGIKTSADTRDKMQGTVDRANEIANRAIAELPRDTAERLLKESERQ